MCDVDGAAVHDGKQQWRARLTAARRARDAAALEEARSAVRGHVVALCAEQGWTCVAGYEPLRTEPGSTQLLADLVTAGVRVLVPVTLPDRELDWVQWGSGDAAPLGRDAIATASAVLVPALAVARDGTRLGRGGGSYDRALPRRAAGVPALALLFDGELVDALPREPWDQPVTGAVLPSRVVAVG